MWNLQEGIAGLGLYFYGENNCLDCPLKDVGFPKFTAWGILLSAGIFPDAKDCGKPVNHWRPVFNALAGFRGAPKVLTLADVGLQSQREYDEGDESCKKTAEELIRMLEQQARCQDCKLWWCY